MTYRHASLFTLVCICLLVLAPPAFGQSSYHYAYLRISDHGRKTEIDTVDSPTETRAYPIPPGWDVIGRPSSVSSPDGEWIASFIYGANGMRLMIQLYNPTSGEARSIIEGYIWSQGKNIAWSPDSQNLALVVGQHPHSTDLLIYSVADNHLRNLSNDEYDQHDISWSSDSSKVLTFTQPCGTNEPCSDLLELFDRATGARLDSFDLAALPFLGASACDPEVSPDGHYVSLISNCGGSYRTGGTGGIYDFPNEVYLWELAANTLEPITRFTHFGAIQLFAGYYRHEWLDDQTLLIGANSAASGESEVQQLLAYRVTDGTTTTLSTTVGSRFAFNHATDQIALEPYQRLHKSSPQYPYAGQSTGISIAALSTSSDGTPSLSATIAPTSVAAACDMSWSPDGATLAVTTSTTNCEVFLESVVLIDGVSGAVQEYPLQVPPDQNTYTIPLGWLQF